VFVIGGGASISSSRAGVRAAAPVGVGTRFIYDGEIVAIVEMFPDKRGNEVFVADRAESDDFGYAA
jgi:hypothetical protein